MKIMSIDSSTTSSGYSIFINGEYIRSDCINLKKAKGDKLPQMVIELFNIIDSERPDTVVVEEMSVVRNAQTARKLTMILGAIYGKCLDEKIEWYSLRPTQWRKWAKDENEKLPRKREELKEWSKDKVLSLFNITVNDDVSDAILIGYGFIKEELKDV